jgi:RimJ/RimL family protein N-acetyltransferase
MTLLETARLAIRPFTLDDAAFVLALVNEPSWIEFIGDKGVRSIEDARAYLKNGPIAMVERLGFGLYRVARKEDDEPIGMCGLVKRDSLDDVDIGFAFLPRFQGSGYAREAAEAVIDYAKTTLALPRLAAITTPHNARSIRLIERLGFTFVRTLPPAPNDHPLHLFVRSL